MKSAPIGRTIPSRGIWNNVDAKRGEKLELLEVRYRYSSTNIVGEQ